MEGLYPRIMGDAWNDLAPSVRELHSGGAVSSAHGDLQVERGSGVVPRMAAWMLGLPSPGPKAMSLRIERHDDGERWDRDFGERRMVSDQWTHAGLFVEKLGASEVHFALVADEGALVLEQRRTALCLGPLRIPLPTFLAPRITGRAEPHGDGVHIDIAIRTLFDKLILRYTGLVQPGERADGAP